MNSKPAFWETKTLEEMTWAEWEQICDGCGKCCLHKFIDDEEVDGDMETTDFLRDGEELIYTSIVCQLLDSDNCHCTQYAERTTLVPDCVQLTKENLKDIFYMPNSCSYRRLYEGRGLPSWHPLLHNGDKQPMHDADMSVKGKVVSEATLPHLNYYDDFVVEWPNEDID